MRQLTIYTHRYNQLLELFTSATRPDSRLTVRRAKKHSGKAIYTRCYSNPTEPDFIEALTALLIDIALQENPVYQHSPKMREMAGDLRGTQVYANLRRGLIRFVKNNRTLHLEGYVAFRMKEYREKLDMMSYSLIKKMKLIRND